MRSHVTLRGRQGAGSPERPPTWRRCRPRGPEGIAQPGPASRRQSCVPPRCGRVGSHETQGSRTTKTRPLPPGARGRPEAARGERTLDPAHPAPHGERTPLARARQRSPDPPPVRGGLPRCREPASRTYQEWRYRRRVPAATRASHTRGVVVALPPRRAPASERSTRRAGRHPIQDRGGE